MPPLVAILSICSYRTTKSGYTRLSPGQVFESGLTELSKTFIGVGRYRRLSIPILISSVMENVNKFTGMNSIKFNQYFKAEEDCLKYIVAEHLKDDYSIIV